MGQPAIYDTPEERNTNKLFLIATDGKRPLGERACAASLLIDIWAERGEYMLLVLLARDKDVPPRERSSAMMEWMTLSARDGNFGLMLEVQESIAAGKKTEFDGLWALEYVDMHVKMAVSCFVKRRVELGWAKELRSWAERENIPEWIRKSMQAGLDELLKRGKKEIGMTTMEWYAGGGTRKYDPPRQPIHAVR